MKNYCWAALLVVLLIAGALTSLAADGERTTHAYSRSSGPRNGFAMDASFLGSGAWDFSAVSGKLMVSQPGDPGELSVHASRIRHIRWSQMYAICIYDTHTCVRVCMHAFLDSKLSVHASRIRVSHIIDARRVFCGQSDAVW